MYQTEWAQGATLVSGQPTVILGPVCLANYVHKAFTLANVGAVTASGAIIQVNPDMSGRDVRMGMGADPQAPAAAPPNPALWENYNTTAFQSLPPAGAKTVYVNGDVARWWRIIGNADLNGVAASGYVNATVP